MVTKKRHGILYTMYSIRVYTIIIEKKYIYIYNVFYLLSLNQPIQEGIVNVCSHLMTMDISEKFKLITINCKQK